MVCKADRSRVTADPGSRLAAMSSIALRICEHADLHNLCMAIYQQLRGLLPIDSFYVALADRQSEGLHGLLVLDDGHEYPPQSLYVPADERPIEAGPAFLGQAQLAQETSLRRQAGTERSEMCDACRGQVARPGDSP